MARESTDFNQRTGYNGVVMEAERPSQHDEDDESNYVRSNNFTPADVEGRAAQLGSSLLQEHAREIEERASHALMGRQVVGVLVAAAVSSDAEAIGRVTDTLLDQINPQSNPVDVSTTEEQVLLINAAAEFAREVGNQAHGESIDLLKQRIVHLEALVPIQVTELMAELHEAKQINSQLKSDNANQRRTIEVLQTEKNARALREYLQEKAEREQQIEITIDHSPRTLRQRLLVGARSAAAYFHPTQA